ncbi:MAG: gamma-glutamyl-gamma-aminobutyrate hydrolase family protein [Erysipelotrichaceae bacterium]|nr:gamma-glutamyl-gamma-aminobutyrate hydrolase family protein [Erysipelotrichaceae bacterium]
MRKPIIGIPAKQKNFVEEELAHFDTLVDEHRLMVCKHGGITIMLTQSERKLDFSKSDLGDDTVLTEEEKQDLYQQVDLCDGIILQGGEFSSEYEVEIARYALKKNLPIIGTCAGFNNILRALGSNIYEDKTEKHSSRSLTYRHPIKIEKDTMLYRLIGKEDYQVNSLHTMICDDERVRSYAKISSHSPDGLVESFEVPDKRFVLAMKWHPELMGDDEGSDKIFTAFLSACNENIK